MKKVISFCMAVVMIFSLNIVAFASGTPTVSVSSATATPGETVQLKVSIANNPGINTFSFGFDYDTSRLSLTNVELASGVPGQFAYSKKAVWLNSNDTAENGDYLVLTFKVLDSASSGDAKVNVTYNVGDISNYNEEDVNFQISAGKITVKDSSSSSNSDGVISVGSATAAPGSTVKLPVTITKNPGINTFTLGFDYDKTKLNLTSVELASGVPGQFTYSKKAVWLNSKDTDYTGEILFLNFKISDNAIDGDAKVNVTYNVGDISNYNEEDVGFQISAGKITVKSSSSPSNSDGVISVGSATAAPGSTIKLPVTITKNPGINTFTLGFDYDKTKLNLTSVELASGVPGQFTYSKKAVWLNSKDIDYTGEILFLNFKVSENAIDGDVPVAVTYNVGDISNYNEEDLYFDLAAGSVKVQSKSVYDTRVSLSKVTGRSGETVNVYVSLDKETAAKSMSIYDVTYDTDKLTLQKGEWVVGNSIIADWNQQDKAGVVTFAQNTNLSGKVFLLKFVINDDLDDCSSEVKCNYKITYKNDSNIEKEIKVEVVPGSVNILNVIRGDVNGDGSVDSDDAVYMLYHVLLPDRYTINQNGNFDGDEHVDSNDATHLLYFTLLPERYPLA